MRLPENIIQSSQDCNVAKFMACCFGGKYDVLLIDGTISNPEDLKTAFEFIYAEFIDLAALWETREFELYAYITHLDGRINMVKQFVNLQKRFIAEFGIPFMAGFGLVKKYGHSLSFIPGESNIDVFLKKLDAILMGEKRTEHEMTIKINELADLHKKKAAKQHVQLQTRSEFVTMLNRLQQNKFVIDREKTTVEDLALIIKDCRDQNNEQKMAAKTKRY